MARRQLFALALCLVGCAHNEHAPVVPPDSAATPVTFASTAAPIAMSPAVISALGRCVPADNGFDSVVLVGASGKVLRGCFSMEHDEECLRREVESIRLPSGKFVVSRRLPGPGIIKLSTVRVTPLAAPMTLVSQFGDCLESLRK